MLVLTLSRTVRKSWKREIGIAMPVPTQLPFVSRRGMAPTHRPQSSSFLGFVFRILFGAYG